MSARAATVRARRGARESNASPVEAAITFRLGAVRAAFWTRYLDDHIAELEARHAIRGISRWRTRHEVRALCRHMERVLATVPCVESPSLRDDFERLVIGGAP